MEKLRFCQNVFTWIHHFIPCNANTLNLLYITQFKKKKKKKSHISAGLPQEQAKKRSFKTASGMHQTTEQVSSQHIKPRQLIIIGHHQGIFAINMQPTMFRLSAKILIAQSVF